MATESLSWEDLSSTIVKNLTLLTHKDRLATFDTIEKYVNGIQDPNDRSLVSIQAIFLNYFNHFSGAPSIKRTTDILLKIFKVNPESLPTFINALEKVTNKFSLIAIEDLVLLTNWVNVIIANFYSIDHFNGFIKSLSTVQLQIFDAAFASKIDKKDVHKDRVRRKIKKTTANAFRVISSEQTSLFVKHVTSSKSSVDSINTLIGTLASKELSSDDQKLILDYYTKIALASKVQLAYPEGLSPFFIKYVNAEIFNATIVPAIEKAIIRSSELSLSFALPVFESLQSSLDLPTSFVSSKLLAQITSSYKSSKAVVRGLAFQNFSIIVKAKSTEESLSKIVEEFLKSLKSISAPDQKALFYRSLSLVPTDFEKTSTKIYTSLLVFVAKDQNESSLGLALNAFFVHLFSSLQREGEVANDVVTAVAKGFKDPKVQLRKLWFENFGSVIDSLDLNEKSRAFITELLPTAVESFEDIVANPTKDIKGIVIPYIVLRVQSLLQSDSTYLFNKALDNSSRPSVLLSPRVYSKFTTAEESSWFVKALLASANYTGESGKELGKAWVSFILSKETAPEVLQLNIRSLQEAYSINQKVIGNSVIDAVSDYLLHSSDETESLLGSLPGRVAVVFHSVFQKSESLNEELLQEQLSRIIVLAHHSKLPPSFTWINTILNAGIDPGTVVKTHCTNILEAISSVLSQGDIYRDSGLFEAAGKAAASAAFVAPSVISPKIRDILLEDLDASHVSSLSLQDIEIWKAKEGELVIDVLQTKKKIEDKNSKDYETRKWEESLKKELASKAKDSRKLTREEQEKVNAQLEKESSIRACVNKLHNSLERSIALAASLSVNVDSVDNGQTVWVAAAVNGLLSVVAVPATQEVVGTTATEAFLKLSSVVSSRLSQLRLFIGVATLRIVNIGALDERFKQEDTLELISRILYRVKFLSDQQPFDMVSLVYMLPLLSKILEQGKIVAIRNSKKPISKSEFVEEDKEEEQLLLTIEIIGNHAEEFKDPAIPRSQIFSVLLSLLALPSKAKLAKECLLTLCQYVSIDFTNEDLKLLFSGLLTPENFVRNTILEALDQEFDLSELDYADEIWIACHDNDEANAELALTIWEENNFKILPSSVRSLYDFLGNTDGGLRLSVSKSLADAIQVISHDSNEFSTIIEELLRLYTEKSRPPEPDLDEFGLVIKSSQVKKDPWETRSGIAITIKLVAELFTSADLVVRFLKFIIEEKALADREPIVAEEFKEAAIEIITVHGKENVQNLIPIFEEALSRKASDQTDELVKENIVVIYGSLARHLSSDDPRLITIIERLLSTLPTSSEKVQKAIAVVIAPLVNLFKPKVGSYIDSLFQQLFSAPTNSRRRGAAYGIAGLTKGYGIAAVSEFDLIRTLSDAADDKKDPKRRESVCVAFECLSNCIGKFFEPYVIEILPILLKALGDSVPEVRDAAALAAKEIMQHTTSYGVKKLIPLAIENLDEISWRTKRGSVDLLGSMAYLDPTQLSASLSTIVPEIVGVLNDSHKEVRKAADQSLSKFGEVIRNPEIQALVPTLIKAIGDPAKKTEDALDALIKTQFVHYIDGPSLALIIHVIHRGMRDRSANTKRKACQIVGNMAILVDTKDLLPYLHQLIEELETAMVDPVPNTRATAARALGSLVEKLGEDHFPDLIPRLLDTLSDETKAGDRLGSAQALAEVISGLGLRKLDELLPTILKGSTSSRASVREGFLPMLLFLPVCFGSQFAPYISQIIPAILNGLADTDESIRATALKSGRLIVKNYASKAVDLLLPELEDGLLDTNYRIRLSSVELTGDLLFQVTGLSGKTELAEEEGEHSGAVNSQLIDVLGRERRDRVLSLLFICRSDTSIVVRNGAIDIWKALVANTPKTIKEILPSLTNIIVRRLANSDEAQRTIAAQALGDLVRRVGANALSQLLPTLEESLESSDADAKQGICIAVHELIESTSESTVIEYQDIFVNIIRSALVDSSASVRQAAAAAFDRFQDTVGKTAVDEIIPYLLNLLQSPDSEKALLALQDVMSTKSEVIFPILIPTLLESPINAFRARALGSMAEVAGKALYRRLSVVISTLVDELIRDDLDNETETELKSSFDKIVLSVEDDGLHPLLQQLQSLIKDDDPKKRAVVYERLVPFFKETRLDYSLYTENIVTNAIMALDDQNEEVVKNAVSALTMLVKEQSKESLERLIKPSKQALQITGTAGQDLRGFALLKGANSVLPIFLHGLMYGNSDQRELAALAIADVVSKTPATSLKPLVTVITGPLIRVIGERFSSDIKAAILFALNILFEKVPQFLRPFIPQLQRTFVKSLSDPNNETLRTRAAKALGTLIEYQAKVDPLASELIMGAKSAEATGVKTAMLKALLEVISKAGEKLSQSSKTSILELVEKEILEADDKLAVAYARTVGALSRILTTEEATQILKTKVLNTPLQGDDSSKFAILTLNAFLKDAPNHIFNTGLLPVIVSTLINGTSASSAYISDNATIAVGKLLLLQNERSSPGSKAISQDAFDIPFPLVHDLVSQLAITALKPQSSSLDTRRLSLVVIRTVARTKTELFKPYWDIIAPSVFSCVRDVIIPIKLAAEKAFLSLFNLVEDEKLESFNRWFEDVSARGSTIETVTGVKVQVRSIGDYTKRVGARLAGIERERIEAGGDEETVFSDRIEDEAEIWAVGGVDITKE